jgi:tetratricopeptide (TPR) repeat protein
MKKHVCLLLFCLFLLAGINNVVFAQSNKKKSKRENTESEKIQVLTPADLHASEQFFLDGQKYFILEDFAKSYVFFQRSISLNPRNAASHFKLAEIHLLQNENIQALNLALKALDLDPNNKFYYLQVAEIYNRQSNFKEAAKVYENLLKKIPDYKDGYFELAAIYFYQGNYEESLKTYNKLEKLTGPIDEITFQKQKIYLKQNRIKEALAEGDALIKAYPDEPNYYLMQAQILLSNNKMSEAIPYLEKVVKEDYRNGQARLMLAEVYKQSGKNDKAEESIQIAFQDPNLPLQNKIQFLLTYIQSLPEESIKELGTKYSKILIETHPHEAHSYAMYGDILFRAESKKEARVNYMKALKYDNSNFNIWQNVVSIDLEINEMDSAIAHSEKALEYFPNQAVMYYFNGIAHLSKKNYKEAAFALEQGKKLSSSNLELLSVFNSNLGDTYNGLKKYDKSDAAYEAALDYDPNNSHVLNNYSYFLSLRKQKLDLAKKMASKLVSLNPDNPTFLDTYAWVLYMLGEYQAAKTYLEKAIMNGESSGVIIEHYGDVLFKLGQKEDALIQWKKAKGKLETSDLLDKKIADKKLYE